MSNVDCSAFIKRTPITAFSEQTYWFWTAPQKGPEKLALRPTAFIPLDKNPRGKTALAQTRGTFTWHWQGYPDGLLIIKRSDSRKRSNSSKFLICKL